MKITDPTFVRVRAACCDEHGLGKDPHALDNHAALITSLALKAKRGERIVVLRRELQRVQH